jgi:hypothetical protein
MSAVDAAHCQECGRRVQADPDGSAGGWMHDRGLGDEGHDADSDRAARPPQELA